MTPFTHSLRPRVALAFALVGAVAGMLLAGGMYLASRDLEQRLVDESLDAEVEDYLGRLARNPRSLPPMTATVRGYLLILPPLPGNNLAGLPPGAEEPPHGLQHLAIGHHDLLWDDIPYRLAVAERSGRRLFLFHDLTATRRRDGRFMALLIGGVTFTALLSAALGVWLAKRLLTPVTELARRVRGRGPEDPLPPLAADFPQGEVGEMARAFDRYLGRLHAFIEREQVFAAAASHELRTPLAIIKGALEVLLADDSLMGRNLARVQRIDRAAREMGELTTALLALAREPIGPPPPAPCCSVTEVLEEVAERYRPLLRDKPVTLTVETQAHPWLAVDRPLLAVTLGNLLRNACAYTRSGQVLVTLTMTDVTVADTGPGISPEELPYIFELRRRENRTSGGAGIGLPLVKRIADRQGWQVTAEPRETGGLSLQLVFGGGAVVMPSKLTKEGERAPCPVA